jgi:phosphoglycolate phosphatase-like HAD superfamily hydrolase
MLQELKGSGYRIFVVSAHPVPGPGALAELESKISSLGVSDFITAFFCSDGSNKDGKTNIIQSIATKYKLNPTDVCMIGDSYYYDYEAGLKAGVRSVFIRNDYSKQPVPLPSDVEAVDHVVDVLDWLQL